MLLCYDGGAAAGQISKLFGNLITTLKTLHTGILQWILGSPTKCTQYHNAAKIKVTNDVCRAPGV